MKLKYHSPESSFVAGEVKLEEFVGESEDTGGGGRMSGS